MEMKTLPEFRNLVFYQVYIRNHTEKGNFAGLEADLQRIRALGVDILYLLPIHPIGILNRKGSLGSPYSISDYRGINPEFGNLWDFQRLLDTTHELGMKLMIDVVFNHTSHDSILVRDHPDWFHQDAAGNPVTTVPEWSDVIDLKYPNPQMEQYLLDTLAYWAGLGVDGFRCDVASIVPVDFWKAARAAVNAVKPGVIWLAESVHTSFILSRRAEGLTAHSDSELFQVFDICYDYDIWPIFQRAVSGQIPVVDYLEVLRFQKAIYPLGACKLRCVENHDQLRMLSVVPDVSRALAWTALEAFNDGPFMIYAGQEAGAKKRPSLFDIDRVNWDGHMVQTFFRRLAAIKKHPALQTGRLIFSSSEPAVVGYWINGGQSLAGIFNVAGEKGCTAMQVPDGIYRDQLTGDAVRVQDGFLETPESACVIEFSPTREPRIEYQHWLV